MKANLNSKKGQNTAEYLIMLTLVAVASIGLFSVFGQTLRQKISQVGNAIAGNQTEYDASQQAAVASGQNANTRGQNEVNMQGIGQDELTSGQGN
jgi:Flp pilus assembly pilin Flp